MSTADPPNSYSIRIMEDIHDPDLVRHWKRIADETDCFPQMYYEWCEPWWRLRSGERKLHVVCVTNADDKIIGIAPLCIATCCGFRTLQSFPIHFGDFYSFLCDDGQQPAAIVTALLAYLTSFERWDCVHLAQINDAHPLFAAAVNAGFVAQRTSGIIVSHFDGMEFDEFLRSLSKKLRS